MKKCVTLFVLAVSLAAPGLARADTFVLAGLLGENEVPPVDTPGWGYAVFYLPDDWSFIYYYVEFADLLAPARNAHIHAGPAGRSGPVVFPLAGVPAATSGWFEGILTPEDFTPGGGLRSYEEAVLAILAGETYVNVHSRAFPNGEIRGQTFVWEP